MQHPEPYNGPVFPTYRYYVHPFIERGPRRVELRVYYDPECLGFTVGWYADQKTADRDRRFHMRNGCLFV